MAWDTTHSTNFLFTLEFAHGRLCTRWPAWIKVSARFYIGPQIDVPLVLDLLLLIYLVPYFKFLFSLILFSNFVCSVKRLRSKILLVFRSRQVFYGVGQINILLHILLLVLLIISRLRQEILNLFILYTIFLGHYGYRSFVHVVLVFGYNNLRIGLHINLIIGNSPVNVRLVLVFQRHLFLNNAKLVIDLSKIVISDDFCLRCKWR